MRVFSVTVFQLSDSADSVSNALPSALPAPVEETGVLPLGEVVVLVDKLHDVVVEALDAEVGPDDDIPLAAEEPGADVVVVDVPLAAVEPGADTV